MKVELDYQKKSYFIFVLQVFPQKSQLDVKILVWFPWFYQIFRETSAIVTNNVSNVALQLWRQNVRNEIIHSVNYRL